IFIVVSYITWGTLRVWRIPEITLPAAMIIIALPLIKITVLRSETDRVRRLAKLHIGIVIAYALLSAYLVLSRGYYSRFFLVSSFAAIMLWQIVDTLFISAGFRPYLVAVPSDMIDQIRTLPNSNLTVLKEPSLDKPVDGVVVDLHKPMEPEWQMFIAECAASGMQLYHAAAIYESYTGRVPLTHLSEEIR